VEEKLDSGLLAIVAAIRSILPIATQLPSPKRCWSLTHASRRCIAFVWGVQLGGHTGAPLLISEWPNMAAKVTRSMSFGLLSRPRAGRKGGFFSSRSGHARQGLAAASAILLRRQQAREIAKTQRPCFAMRTAIRLGAYRVHLTRSLCHKPGCLMTLATIAAD
jgi:hypothetical protein